MNRILLIEDNLEMVEIVRQILNSDALVDFANLRAEVKKHLSETLYDLFLIDLNLSDSHGYDVFSMIRNDERHQFTPIVFLTADDSDQSQVTGFKLGADDYIVKPIRASIFKARVIARLKRAKENPVTSAQRQYGSLTIDPLGHQAYVTCLEKGRKPLPLTPLEFKILNVFIRKKEQVVERRTLISEAWGKNMHVSSRVVDQHVSSLRRKLPIGMKWIHTVYGIGYKFLETRKRS